MPGAAQALLLLSAAGVIERSDGLVETTLVKVKAGRRRIALVGPTAADARDVIYGRG
jgi:hypothetical protein